MKILYHHRIASKDGQYVHIEELIHSLRSLGHQVVVVEPAQLSQKRFGTSANAVASLRSRLPGFVHELAEFCYTFFDFCKLVGVIIRDKPDCIYERYNLFWVSGIWAKKLFSLPLLLEVNSPLFLERNKHRRIQLKGLARWSERYVWRHADYVLPVTAVLADMVVAEGVRPEQCRVIANGINAERFSNTNGEALRQRLGLQHKLVLGFVGFVRSWHRLDRVLAAISRHRDENWHLLLVGDGPAKAELQRQAEALGVSGRVSFVGVVDRSQVADYIAAFDIALQPDVVEYASPLKLFEYMALSKAILAPNRPNLLEILADGENALLFDADDELSFNRQLQRLCASADLRQTLGQAAGKTLVDKQLFWLENAKKVEALFMSLRAEP